MHSIFRRDFNTNTSTPADYNTDEFYDWLFINNINSTTFQRRINVIMAWKANAPLIASTALLRFTTFDRFDFTRVSFLTT